MRKPIRYALSRVYLNSQGYDRDGRYYGAGAPLYWYEAQDVGDDTFPTYSRAYNGALRALSRAQAKAQIRAIVPNATFYK
jgi:hypothetical protein